MISICILLHCNTQRSREETNNMEAHKIGCYKAQKSLELFSVLVWGWVKVRVRIKAVVRLELGLRLVGLVIVHGIPLNFCVLIVWKVTLSKWHCPSQVV